MAVADTGFFTERNIRRARLGAGLVMFVFVTLHLSNHAVGLISVNAADDARRLFMIPWRNPVGTVVLYTAIFIHMALALRSLYIRRSLVMPKGELAQIALGLAIPLIIMDHVIGTRVVHELYNYVDNYETIVRLLWITSPGNGVRQALAVVIVWTHGCIGLHYWLRYRPWYQAFSPLLLALAILLPVLALLGFVEMGRTIAEPDYEGLVDTGRYQENLNSRYYSDPDAQRQIAMIRAGLYGGFSLALLTVVLARSRRRWKEATDQIAVHYPAGETIKVPRGFTVLEASRLGGVPHYSVCGGKGQCSTCRVQIIEGAENLPPPEPLEQKTLNRIGATPDVRLACQLRPTGNVSVVPLLTPMAEATIPVYTQAASPGREREIVVFFCDLRHFTSLTESRLPFDIVFLLNRYFAIVGRIIEENGGRMDKFIGDGAMALFGLRTTPKEANRQALKAAAAIIREIDKLSDELADELTAPLEIAIGIHTGLAVVGSMGYGTVKNVTAIGDTVNVASRLESVAKEFNTALVFSEPVAQLSEADIAGTESREIAVRGRGEPLRVYIVSKEASGHFA